MDLNILESRCKVKHHLRPLQVFVIIHNVLKLVMYRLITLCRPILTVLFNKTMQLLGFNTLFEPIIFLIVTYLYIYIYIY